VEERLGPVTGVVHAAGVPGSGLVELTDGESAAAVLAPKVAGTLALAGVFGDGPLDAFVLCSSVSALTGGIGQADYTAANAFLDAWARSTGRVPAAVSIGWGAWLETGMYAAWQRGGGRALPHAHPWLTGRTDGAGDAVVLHGTLRPDQWVLDEHRVDGVAVLPGTAMAELLLAGARAVRGDGPLALRDVVFVAPLAVPDGAAVDVEVTATPAPDGEHGLVLRAARAGGHDVHAVATATPAGGAREHDLAVLAAAAPERTEPGGRVPFEEPWLAFGPRWASVHAVARGPAVRLAELVAPPAAADELADFTVHPALLDAATAFGGGGVPTGGRFLPAGYDRLTVHGPLPPRLHAVLRPGPEDADERRADVVLCDPDGREVVRVDGFRLRRVAPAPSASASGAGPAAGTPPQPGIRPAEGAEALRRVLAARLGPHVIVSAVPLHAMSSGLRPAAVHPQARTGDGPVRAAGPVAPEPAPEPRHGPAPSGSPRSEVESRVAALWSEVLGVDDIGVDDDYFELGGNSMAGVQLLWRVGEELGVTLTMRQLFDAPTVAGMAGAVAAAPDTAPPPAAQVIEIAPRSPA
jgi:acyl carrier protein